MRWRAVWLVPWIFAVVMFGHIATDQLTHMPTGYGWIDAYVYMDGAQQLVDDPAHLYDSAAQRLSHTDKAQRQFIYPPSALIPFVALVPLMRATAEGAAAGVWVAVDTLALFAALVLIGRRLRIGWPLLGVAMAVIAVSAPVYIEIHSGQVHGVVMLLVTLAWARAPSWRTGVLLGLAVALKPITLLLLLAPLLRGQWRVTAIAVATAALVNLPFVGVLGIGQVWFYAVHVLPSTVTQQPHDPNNLSLASLINTWVGGATLDSRDAVSPSPLALPWLATALIWAARVAVVAAWARVVRSREVSETWVLLLSLAAIPILAGMVWGHYYVFFLPLLLGLLSLASRRQAVLLLGATLALTYEWGRNGMYGIDPLRDGGYWWQIRDVIRWEFMPLYLLMVFLAVAWRLRGTRDRPAPWALQEAA